MTTALSADPPTRRTLFDIGRDLLALDELIEDLGGDISDPAVERAVTAWFAELAADEAVKLDGWCGYIRQLEMEALTATAEAEQFKAKATARTARVAWLKARMKDHLTTSGRTKVQTASGRTIAVQANGGKPPVVFTADSIDPAAVPDSLCRIKREIDNEKVRTALEKGETVPFAKLGDRGTQLRIR